MREGIAGLARWGPRHEELLRVSVPALFVVTILDALVGRALSRASMFIPRGPASDAAFEILGRSSVFLFNLVVVLVVLLLFLLLWPMSNGVRRLPVGSGAAYYAVSALLVLSIASFAIRDVWLLVALAVLFLGTVLLILGSAVAETRSPWPRAFAALAALTYGSSRYFLLASTFGQLAGASAPPAAGLEFLRLAEAAAALAPIPLFAAVYLRARGRPAFRIPAIAPSLATAAFVFAAVGSPSITAAIAEFSLGFTLYLPLPVYALGLWLAVASLVILWRDPAVRAKAYGIGLVMLAGVDLRLTSQALLAVAGLLLWALETRTPEPTPGTVARTAPAPAPASAVGSGPAARG